MNRKAFTLTEVLIVIGIITLVLLMAVPAFNYMTGARSIEAGENVISAMLGRARAEALRAQDERGVAFFVNTNNGRLTMAMIALDPAGTSQHVELMEERDWQPLQPGIAASFLNDDPTEPYVDLGILIFDGTGRLIPKAYQIRNGSRLETLGFTPRNSTLGIMLYDRQAFENATDPVAWVNDNGHLLLVNRYNGTLVRSE